MSEQEHWILYEMLKGNITININVVEKMSSNELREGIIEYLHFKKQAKQMIQNLTDSKRIQERED